MESYDRTTLSLRSLSSVYGKIEMVLLIYPGTAQEVDAVKISGRYAQIFAAFGDRVTFVILANHVMVSDHRAEYEMVNQFREALASSHLYPQHHVVVVGTALPQAGDGEASPPHGDWAQDPFVVAGSGQGQVVLIEPMFHTHPQNALLAEQLASSAGILLRPTRFHVEGGNVLTGDDYALVGRSTFVKNWKRYFPHLKEPEAEALLTGEFKRLLGMKYLLWVGFGKERGMPLGLRQDEQKVQPLFHIDLFCTLAGKDKSSGDEVLLLAKVMLEDVQYEDEQGQGRWSAEVKKFADALDEIGACISKSHTRAPGPRFLVERLPMGLAISHDGMATVYSYSNAHVEWFHGIKRMYLPRYPRFATASGRGPSLEDKVERLLTGLGFRCVFVDNSFEQYSKYGNGSLHCLSKVLLRGNY